MKSFANLLSSMFVAAMYLALTVAAVSDEPAAVPRYEFGVGQELTYSQNLEFKVVGKGDNFAILGHTSELKAWVVRKNDDGSWRIVLHLNKKSWVEIKGKKKEGGDFDYVSNTLAYCDLFPDGRLVPNESLGFHLHLDLARGDRPAPSQIFPRLPKDLQVAATGWEDFHEFDGARSRFTRAKDVLAPAASWVFEEVHQSPMDQVFVSSRRSKYFFDRKRGLIERATDETTQGYGFHGKGTGLTELKEVKNHDDAWVKRFAEETEHYFAANKTYLDLTTQAGKDKAVKSLLDKAAAALKEVRDKLTLPMLRALANYINFSKP